MPPPNGALKAVPARPSSWKPKLYPSGVATEPLAAPTAEDWPSMPVTPPSTETLPLRAETAGPSARAAATEVAIRMIVASPTVARDTGAIDSMPALPACSRDHEQSRRPSLLPTRVCDAGNSPEETRLFAGSAPLEAK